MSSLLDRPALGQTAGLGNLYDARSDTFIPLSILKAPFPPSTVETTQKHSTSIKISKTDTYKEKFDTFGMDSDLSASFLAGLVKVGGAGRYLSDRRDTSLVVQSSLHYHVTTVEEGLNLAASNIKECLAIDFLDKNVATHVVTKISWGARCIITAKGHLQSSEDRSQLAGELEAQFGLLRGVGLAESDGPANIGKDGGHTHAGSSFEVTVFGDVLATDGLMPSDFATSQRFIRNVPKYISEANGGKGQPLTYTLMPLSLFNMFRILEIKANTIIHQLGADCLQRYVQLFDDMQESLQNLHDYRERLRSHSASVPPDHVDSIAALLASTITNETTLKSRYASLLVEVRGGNSDPQKLWDLLTSFIDGATSPRNILSAMTYHESMDFEDVLKREGAHFVGYQGPSASTLINQSEHDDVFVLYFNDLLRRQSDSWTENLAVFLELIRDTSRNKLALAIDCDAYNIPLENPYISHRHNGRVITEDVVEQRKILAANCVATCCEDALDRSNHQKPLQRRAVKIPCPGHDCDITMRCNWICGSCQSAVEYGFVDDLLYCGCGAGVYHAWKFQCNDPGHGSAWVQYDRTVLQKLLKALEPLEELNVLILGETGVGKSTWINSFINYLTYESLDDALQAEQLKWVIHCSFQAFDTQYSDDESLVPREVKIGSSKSEIDGSAGQSATQSTSVYTVNMGDTLVRLIDTPGIGDTRGVSQDNENMTDILTILRTYNNLHGILILLKPNASRLTVMFRFCIKQLLTHLHRNAARNIAFGFTNTRSSHYKPGDTFKPLGRLLEEYQSVKIGLVKHNVYCFDSESFRYLAARKKGIDIGLLEDNRSSWEHSVRECERLVKHFQGIIPHQVRSTINLNETRNAILRLTEPMTLLAEKISASIDVNNDQIKELRDFQLTRQQLEQRLFVQKESLESYEVDQPRTVCTHSSCVEVRSDFEGRQEAAIVYKTMCHRPCYLDGVDRNKKGHRALQRCASIGANGLCQECGHGWMDHMHIYYEYQPMTYKHRDEAVDRDLIDNASNIQLREEAIQMKEIAIEEFRLEHSQVQEAAIQFGFFLKRHAITPYNDATIEYVDMLIDQEKIKIRNGGSKNRLVNLNKYKAKHLQKVEVLDKAMKDGDSRKVLDDAGVRQLVDSLYSLPHFGKDLQDIVRSQEKAAEATYRERSYNVAAGPHFNRALGRKSRLKSIHRTKSGQAHLPRRGSSLRFKQIPGAFPGESEKRSAPSETASAATVPRPNLGGWEFSSLGKKAWSLGRKLFQ